MLIIKAYDIPFYTTAMTLPLVPIGCGTELTPERWSCRRRRTCHVVLPEEHQ